MSCPCQVESSRVEVMSFYSIFSGRFAGALPTPRKLLPHFRRELLYKSFSITFSLPTLPIFHPRDKRNKFILYWHTRSLLVLVSVVLRHSVHFLQQLSRVCPGTVGSASLSPSLFLSFSLPMRFMILSSPHKSMDRFGRHPLCADRPRLLSRSVRVVSRVETTQHEKSRSPSWS